MERRQVREESHHSKCYEHRVSFTCSSSPPCTDTHTLCMLSSQPVFQISAHTLNKTRILPSVNTQADTSMCNTHTHTHNNTPLYLKTFKCCWASFLWASQHSEWDAVVSIPFNSLPTLFIASLYISFYHLHPTIIHFLLYTSRVLSSLCSVFPFFPHFCHYFPAAWKLNCDPSCCSILGALTWECISIHCGVYIWPLSFMCVTDYQSSEKCILSAGQYAAGST